MDNEAKKKIIVSVLESRTKEMEGYCYYGSNPGVSQDDYEEIAEEIVEQFNSAGVFNG